jgi:hypothetical protein
VPSVLLGVCVGAVFFYSGGKFKEKTPRVFVAHSSRLSDPVRIFQALGELVGVGVC